MKLILVFCLIFFSAIDSKAFAEKFLTEENFKTKVAEKNTFVAFVNG
jgi:hypothetical protein